MSRIPGAEQRAQAQNTRAFRPQRALTARPRLSARVPGDEQNMLTQPER